MRLAEFFAAHIRNPNTRAAYLQAVCQFLEWAEAKGLALKDLNPFRIAAYVENLPKRASQPIERERQSRKGKAYSVTVTGLPALQHSTGMGVPQIVNPRRMAVVGDRPAQPRENRVNRAVGQGSALLRDKETPGEWEAPLTATTVRLERREGCPMQGHPTRLMKLAVAYEQSSVVEIDFGYFQSQGFGDAQPRASQQTDQGLAEAGLVSGGRP
jgi:hypothetical protein